MSNHSVFVLHQDGTPLTPTTPAKARKLLRDGKAKKAWSKFGTFGIQLLFETDKRTPLTTLGYDVGTKFEGFAVVCGDENVLAVKLDLPDKSKLVAKLDERRQLRRARRFRKTRRRPARFDNRTRKPNWLAPSQRVIVQSRLKVLAALFAIYPIQRVGLEDVRFNHTKHRWGAHFSTAEIGKHLLQEWLLIRAEVTLYQGWQTERLRKQYGYRKTSQKSAHKFTAHCSDALALACEVGVRQPVEPGLFLVVDDTYRSVKRRLHDTQPAKGSIREPYSTGTVFGLRKGLLIGAANRNIGRLSGKHPKGLRYYDLEGKRKITRSLRWVSSQFVVKRGRSPSPTSARLVVPGER